MQIWNYTLVTFALALIIGRPNLTYAQESEKELPAGESVNALFAHDYYKEQFEGRVVCKRRIGRPTECHSLGVRTYFYSNGSCAKRIRKTKRKSYYLDQFDKSGHQLLKDGKGFYVQIETGTRDFPTRDSLVYEITDGSRTGLFRRYRRYQNTSYYLMETGKLVDNKKEGTWTTIEPRLGIEDIETYSKDVLTGYHFRKQKLENLVEYGTMRNNYRTGVWTTCDTNMNKREECSYSRGYRLGYSVSYYPNGVVSAKGNYVQVKGFREDYVDKPNGEQVKVRERVNNIEVKDGDWTYYNMAGDLVRTERYERGILR